MLNFSQEPSFEQGLKDAINKLTNQLPTLKSNDYQYRQTITRIQVFKRVLNLLNEIPERTSSNN